VWLPAAASSRNATAGTSSDPRAAPAPKPAPGADTSNWNQQIPVAATTQAFHWGVPGYAILTVSSYTHVCQDYVGQPTVCWDSPNSARTSYSFYLEKAASQPTTTPTSTPTTTPSDFTPEVNPNRLVHCSGTARGGFFRKLAQRRTTCSKARRLMKTWIRASGFGTRRGTKGTTDVFVYRCRLLMLRGVDNPYARITCTSESGKYVRFYGIS